MKSNRQAFFLSKDRRGLVFLHAFLYNFCENSSMTGWVRCFGKDVAAHDIGAVCEAAWLPEISHLGQFLKKAIEEKSDL